MITYFANKIFYFPTFIDIMPYFYQIILQLPNKKRKITKRITRLAQISGDTNVINHILNVAFFYPIHQPFAFFSTHQLPLHN